MNEIEKYEIKKNMKRLVEDESCEDVEKFTNYLQEEIEWNKDKITKVNEEIKKLQKVEEDLRKKSEEREKYYENITTTKFEIDVINELKKQKNCEVKSI